MVLEFVSYRHKNQTDSELFSVLPFLLPTFLTYVNIFPCAQYQLHTLQNKDY